MADVLPELFAPTNIVRSSARSIRTDCSFRKFPISMKSIFISAPLGLIIVFRSGRATVEGDCLALHPSQLPNGRMARRGKRRGRRAVSEPDTPESASRFASVPDQEAPRRIGLLAQIPAVPSAAHRRAMLESAAVPGWTKSRTWVRPLNPQVHLVKVTALNFGPSLRGGQRLPLRLWPSPQPVGRRSRLRWQPRLSNHAYPEARGQRDGSYWRGHSGLRSS